MRPALGWKASVVMVLAALQIAVTPIGAPRVLAQAIFADGCSLALKTPTEIIWSGRGASGYNPFKFNGYFEPFQISVSHSGPSCEYMVVIQSDARGGQSVAVGGRHDLAFSVVSSTSSSQSLVSSHRFGEDRNRIRGSFNSRSRVSSQSIRLFARIADRQAALAQRYRSNLIFTIFEVRNGLFLERHRRIVPFLVNVQPVADISFQSGQFDPPILVNTFDFGDDIVNAQRDTVLYARTNTDLRLSISSDNGGEMKHVDPSVEYALNYQLLVDGQPVPLQSAYDVNIPGGMTGRRPGETAIPISVLLENDPTRLPAGNYADTVRFRIVVD